MEEFFAARAASNDELICIGSLSRAEAPEAVELELGDGLGIYIYLAKASEGGRATEVLGRLANEEAARILSRLFGFEAMTAT